MTISQKRIIANVIDGLACTNPIGIVGLLINSYLYYWKGTTLGLMMFNLRLVFHDNVKPSIKILIKRFAYKYLGLLLLVLISALGSNIFAYIIALLIQYIVPEGSIFAMIVFSSRVLSGLAIFGLSMRTYYKKNNMCRREKSSKTHYIIERNIVKYVMGKA